MPKPQPHYTIHVKITKVQPEFTDYDTYGKIKDSGAREVHELLDLTLRDEDLSALKVRAVNGIGI